MCRDSDGNVDPRYARYAPWTGLAAASFAVGVPLLFYYLVRRFKRHGQRGDTVVQKALEWPVKVPRNT